MRVSIHQPNFMPGSNFFYKISQSDVFIILDDVQFEKNGYTNRTKIRVNYGQGWDWLTIPIKKHPLDTNVNDIQIANDDSWRNNILAKIDESYHKANNFDKIFPILENHFNNEYNRLSDLNVNLIFEFCRFLNLNPKITFSSNFELTSTGAKRIEDLCLKVGARYYISGMGGKKYLGVADFKNRGIEVRFVAGKHKEYKQVYAPFIEGLSELDYIMCEAEL